ncbi:MAG: formylglycine-generating enzyme family protein [Candidatus Limimorpha sp.]
MKKFALLTIASLCLFFFGCREKKTEGVKLELYVSDVNVVADVTSASITGKYSSNASVDNFVVIYGETMDLKDGKTEPCVISNNNISVSLSNLNSGTCYYFCFEYSNQKDSGKTDVMQFTTLSLLPPVVTTDEVREITMTSAVCGGSVTNDGGDAVTAKGVCWSISENPTIDDAHTADGEGTGSYNSEMTGLTENTTYYVRAYATNGVGTSYGEQRSFTTNDVVITAPVVTTNDVVDIDKTTAVCGGLIVSDGGSAVTKKGVCWSTEENPTIDESCTNDGIGSAAFTSNITYLQENTTYYVRAYATNSVGTSYGEQKSFTTLEAVILTPSVTTKSVSNINGTYAFCGGVVTSDGGSAVTAKGICWSTSENPTIDDAHTADGEGTGSYNSEMTGLTENTTYYVRAYATNAMGTGYGNQASFETLPFNNLVVTVNGVTFEMIGVEGGTFKMGAQNTEQYSPNYDEEANNNEAPVHDVTLSNFYIGKFEVTQDIWVAVMGSNPSYLYGPNLPVEMVSWDLCHTFINELNSLTGMNFRLPTEAEWEYAAKGGNKSMHFKYSGSDDLEDVAWFGDNSNSMSHGVGLLAPNELGIYDMSGNVSEWCEDYYQAYTSEPQTNPQGPATGSFCVYRGGGWVSNAKTCRSTHRNSIDPDYIHFILGLRLAIDM